MDHMRCWRITSGVILFGEAHGLQGKGMPLAYCQHLVKHLFATDYPTYQFGWVDAQCLGDRNEFLGQDVTLSGFYHMDVREDLSELSGECAL